MKMTKRHFLIIGLVFILMCCQSTNKQNSVTLYLSSAEIQCEGDEQKANIVHALKDVLHLSEDQLRKQRYKDYEGNEQQWDLPTLVKKHFVTDANHKSLGDNFYHEIKEKHAQLEVKKILKKINPLK